MKTKICSYEVTFNLIKMDGSLCNEDVINCINTIASNHKQIKEIKEISDKYFKAIVICEDGKISNFNMQFSKKLISYSAFSDLITVEGNKRRLFNCAPVLIK